ncbi:MAG: transporter [Caldithrix sp.]|nr:transporter [Caldithrix sp.]
MKFHLSKLLLMIFLGISMALASGFSIYEQNARATAMAGAFIAQGTDASAVFYNPAALTKLDGLHINAGTTIISTDFGFSGPEAIEANQYTPAEPGLFPPSTVYLSYKMFDQISLGFGIYSLYGLSSKWTEGLESWPGEQLSTNAKLESFFYNPTLAVKIIDNLSVAAGFSFIQSSVRLEENIYYVPRSHFVHSVLEADGSGYGLNLALMFRPFDKMNIGIHYRNNATLEYDNGDARFSFSSTGNNTVDQELRALFPAEVKGSSELELPSFLGIGIAYRFTDNLLAEFDYTQFGWSSYDKLVVEFDQPVGGETISESVKNYEDSYSMRFGLEYRFFDKMHLRAGYIWDRHAVPEAYVEPSLPDGDRHNYTIGLGYQWNTFSLDLAYQALLQDDREINNSVHGFNGEYKGLANIFAISLGYSLNSF